MTLQTRTLPKHFEHLAESMKAYAAHTGLADHGTVVGTAREGFIRLFLQQNLPSLAEYTSGQVIDDGDRSSGQIDIIIQSAQSPKIHLADGVTICLIDGVIGTIEVKSHINTSDDPLAKSSLTQALNTTKRVKALVRQQRISSIPLPSAWPDCQHPNTPCFIFAYAGPNAETLVERIRDYGKNDGLAAELYLPEVIVVLDKGYALVRNDGYLLRQRGQDEYLAISEPYSPFFLFAYICQLLERWNAVIHSTLFEPYLNR